ncbi:hypothetical protein GCM10027449_28300 [Sinomonas notoginsengisoli]|uniref:hypothetical protein n=1 Tax=Sinomonas notoginsengisoli TaxID=1457311 RepID=UPI001F1E74A5|nr:hypothetical protein [Sinomonas notoginsengisoli]
MSSTVSDDSFPRSDNALKSSLHRVFDSQIPNYGDYNLVCVTECGGTVSGQRVGIPVPTGQILGYRRRPVELVMAPFHRETLAPLGQPTTIDLTNLAYVAESAPETFDVATSTGRIVTFTLRSACTLGPEHGMALGQDEDAADLAEFLRELIGL